MPRIPKKKAYPSIDPEGVPGLVSVVVPTYNRAYCLTKSIDSALAQTYRNIEVIVIDDGSSDNTRLLIEKAYASEPRVRYVHQSNGGVAVARNHGIRLSRGEFMALLDSDDVWKPWKTEVQVQVLRERPEVGMTWTDMEAVNPDGELIAPRFLRTMYSTYQWFPTTESLFTSAYMLPGELADRVRSGQLGRVHVGDIFSPMMMGNLVHTSTVLMRRERLAIVGYFPENLRHAGEDYDFHLRTCHAGPVAFVDAPSIYYRVGWHDQITVKDFNFFFARGYLKSARGYLHADRDRIHLSPSMIQLLLAQAYEWVGSALFRLGKRRLARRFLIRSLGYQFWQPRVYVTLLRTSLPHWSDGMLLKGYRAVKRLVRPTPVEIKENQRRDAVPMPAETRREL
ncbi:MAG: glycosyltransferase family 2 protein [Nitrospira sp.]|nr:glycosyltransferase family 2 protein [Nitrospira sp.]